MKVYLFILAIFLSKLAITQEMARVEISSEDPYHYYINDNDSTNLFYYKMLPAGKPIGALVLLPSAGESIESMLNQITLHKEAVKNDLLVIMPSYNMGTIQQIPELNFFDTIFKQVVEEHAVPKDNFIFCGLSKGAMISLTYGIRSVRDSSTYLVPKGIIGIDPPVDLARLYRYCEREIERNFSNAGLQEAKWLKSVYEQVYGGSPDSVPMKYQEGSTFTYGAEKGGNAQYLNDIAIRMHSDLNIDFLINQRKRDLYDWNGTDIVAFVNQLKINGNKQADVIISQNKGKRMDGSANPHSWSIIDSDTTINWILKILNQEQSNTVKENNQRFFVNDVLSKKSYLEDLNQLVDSIQTNHPQPYEFIPRNEFEKRVEQLKGQITDSTTIAEFAWTCNAISAMAGCLHTYNFSNSFNLSPDLFFPVNVQYIDNKLYVTKLFAPNPELKPGMEILKINGMAVSELKSKIASHISSDGYNQHFIQAITNNNFGYFSGFQLNFPPVYKVVIKENGIEKEIELKKNLPDTPNASKNQTKNLSFNIKPSEKLATLTIKSFVYYDEQLPVFKSFIDSCFTQIELNGIKNIVIDLRDNGGGDPYCAAYLLQYLSDTPFRYYKKGSTAVYKDLEEKINPVKNNFSGNIFVLINSTCCSTTGHLCSILKYKKIGVLIGEETGATYSCNAHTINFKLKHSGINVSVATKTYQTDVTGFDKNKGITPDHQTNRTLEEILEKRDLEMEKVLELIGD